MTLRLRVFYVDMRVTLWLGSVGQNLTLSHPVFSRSSPFQDNPAVRIAALSLFGALAKFGTGPSETSYAEQVDSNFVSIVLHLNDEAPDVVKARTDFMSLR